MTVIYCSFRSPKGSLQFNKEGADAFLTTDLQRELAHANAAFKRANNEMARARRKLFQIVEKSVRAPTDQMEMSVEGNGKDL